MLYSTRGCLLMYIKFKINLLNAHAPPFTEILIVIIWNLWIKLGIFAIFIIFILLIYKYSISFYLFMVLKVSLNFINFLHKDLGLVSFYLHLLHIFAFENIVI